MKTSGTSPLAPVQAVDVKVRNSKRWSSFAIALATLFTSTLVVSDLSSASTTRAVPEMVVSVAGSSTTYVVDLVGCEQVRCLRLYRSNVLATSFHAVSLPPVAPVRSGLTGTLERLDFATSRVGFALVGEGYPAALYTTTDGARWWHRINVSGGESVLGLGVSDQFVYVVNAQCSATGVCRNYRVSHSTLNTRHWTSTPLPRAN